MAVGSNIETRTYEQLGRTSTISAAALLGVQEPGGPVKSIEAGRLLAQLYMADVAYETRAALYADLAHAANSIGRVFADPTLGRNGYYQKSGGPGTGAWTLIGVDTLSLRNELGAAGGANIVDFIGLTGRIDAEYDGTNPADFGWRLQAIANDKDLDGIRIEYQATGDDASGYGGHIIAWLEASSFLAGAFGAAADGPGTGSAQTGNRRGVGAGHGGIFTRDGSGAGYGGVLNFAGTGLGGGALVIKQTTTGDSSGDSGTGPALTVENSTIQGQAIWSYTTEDNDDPISHIFERRNAAFGLVADIRSLTGGAMSGPLGIARVLLQPGTDLTGSAPITLLDIQASNKVKSSGQVTLLSVVDNSVNAAGEHYSGYMAVLGPNAVNRTLRLIASGASGANIALHTTGNNIFESGIQATGLPTYANDVAAGAGLFPGEFYKTATGELRIKL